MTLSLARALAPRGVLLYVVSPGWVATDMSTAHLGGPRATPSARKAPSGGSRAREEWRQPWRSSPATTPST